MAYRAEAINYRGPARWSYPTQLLSRVPARGRLDSATIPNHCALDPLFPPPTMNFPAFPHRRQLHRYSQVGFQTMTYLVRSTRRFTTGWFLQVWIAASRTNEIEFMALPQLVGHQRTAGLDAKSIFAMSSGLSEANPFALGS